MGGGNVGEKRGGVIGSGVDLFIGLVSKKDVIGLK